MHPEAGTTMIELSVAMVLMLICGAICTAALVTLFRAADRAQAITASTQENNAAFQKLDRTVRYSSAVTAPGIGSNGDWYVEFQSTVNDVPVCTQLRLDVSRKQLRRRTWNEGSSPPDSWSALASNLSNGSAAVGSSDQPFTLTTPGNGRPTLTVTLVSVAGPTGRQVSSRSTFSLTAANADIGDVASTSVCQGMRS